MGTHGAIIVNSEQGEHYCVEVTGDGQTIAEHGSAIISTLLNRPTHQLRVDFIESLIRTPVNQSTIEPLRSYPLVGWHASDDESPNSGIEYHDEREHEQEYSIYIDFKKGQLSTYNVPLIRTDTLDHLRIDFVKIEALLQDGWTCEQGGADCYQLSH